VLYQRWKQVVSRSTSIIEPRFAVSPVVPVGPDNPGTEPFPDRGTSGNWAGVVAYPPNFNDPVTSVAGQWTVPHVSAPKADDSAYICATWIGIDGWQPENTARIPLLQAGTTQLVHPIFFGPLTWPWWEWVPADPITIMDFAVSPGDFMSCEIRAGSPSGATEAAIHLANLTTGVATSFAVAAPPETQLSGYCAEWIVEIPTATALGLPLKLARYASVYFDNCHAQSRSGRVFSASPGELVTMVNADNYPISQPTIVGDYLVRVDWESGQPVI
jgi:hypothetical protein